MHLKAIADRNNAKHKFEHSKEKLRIAQDEEKKPKNKLMTRISKPISRYEQRMSQAESDLKQATGDMDKATMILAKTKEMEVSRFAQIARQFKTLEESRFNTVRTCLREFAVVTEEYHSRYRDSVDVLLSSVHGIAPENDVNDFMVKNPTMMTPPDWVVKDIVHQQLEEKDEEDELNLLFRRTQEPETEWDLSESDSKGDLELELKTLDPGSLDPDHIRPEFSVTPPLSLNSSWSKGAILSGLPLQRARSNGSFSGASISSPSGIDGPQWTQYWDDDYQEYYYVHVDGTSQWEKPDAPFNPCDEVVYTENQ